MDACLRFLLERRWPRPFMESNNSPFEDQKEVNHAERFVGWASASNAA